MINFYGKLFAFVFLITATATATATADFLINGDVDSTFFQKCLKQRTQKYFEECNRLNNKQFPQNTTDSNIFPVLKNKVDEIDKIIGNKITDIPISTISISKYVFEKNNYGSKYLITYHLENNENYTKEYYIFYNLNNNIQRINLGVNFKILNSGMYIIKGREKYKLNNKGLYEVMK